MRQARAVPASSKRVLIAILCSAFAFALAACDGCDDATLTDATCKPGNPAQGIPTDGFHEICRNNLDDDCDGIVDEGDCGCADGAIQTCGTDEGQCEHGEVTCVNGVFPPCMPLVDTSTYAEMCNGLDDDCDGKTDADDSSWQAVPCIDLPSTRTATSVVFGEHSLCRLGKIRCATGRESCEGDQPPFAYEFCNGVDDDCDGEIDEDPIDIGMPCGPQNDLGRCEFGLWECRSGERLCGDNTATSSVVEPVYPANEEECNGVDDDCDGQIDEDIDEVRLCFNGACRGISFCIDGGWDNNCDAPAPEPEQCDNGVDDDCDGDIDEECLCEPGRIEDCDENVIDTPTGMSCGLGWHICLPNGQWDVCHYALSVPEECNNRDDDCDGQVDGMTYPCGVPMELDGIGQCRTGTVSCIGGVETFCEGAVPPSLETCDTVDNDCDGLIDEDIVRHDKVDIVFAVDISGSMCTYTTAIANALLAYVAQFQNTDHRFALVYFPGALWTWTPPYAFQTTPHFTDIAGFQQALATLGCSGGGAEPSYDVLYELSSPTFTATVGWRSDAWPIIIVIGDETAQWVPGGPMDVPNAEQIIGSQTLVCQLPACQAPNCQMPACVPGSPIEVFIFTRRGSGNPPVSFVQWYDGIVTDPSRIFEIHPADEMRYRQDLGSAFSGACRSAGP